MTVSPCVLQLFELWFPLQYVHTSCLLVWSRDLWVDFLPADLKNEAVGNLS